MGRVHMPLSCQVEDEFVLNSPPRACAQLGGSVARHPSWILFAEITQVSTVMKETRTRTGCGGVPTWMSKVDHEPTLPSLKCRKRHQRGPVISLATMGLPGNFTHKRPLGGTTMGAASEFTVVFAILTPVSENRRIVKSRKEQSINIHRLQDLKSSSEMREPEKSKLS